ncbi:MAG: hypothetical protein IJA85_10325 [Clostridia bacterium]|nr:hypothetical protein [Clostridia bacterium]
MAKLTINKILGSAVADSVCKISTPALAKLAASASDVSAMLDYTAEDGIIAVYDEASHTVSVAAGDEKTEIKLEFIPCAHPHPIAEKRMVELDPVAISAENGKIALIGDSLFNNWQTPDVDMGMPGEVYNYGVGGYCIPNLDELVVPRYILPTSPSVIIVHVGINDMFQGGVPLETYLADVKAFFEKLHTQLPEAKICFLSIVRPTDIAPTVSGIVGPEADARRDAIDNANKTMAAYCAEREWAAYLDAEAAYCDDKGRSKVENFAGDGIHLLPHAYPAWGRAIAEALLKI